MYGATHHMGIHVGKLDKLNHDKTHVVIHVGFTTQMKRVRISTTVSSVQVFFAKLTTGFPPKLCGSTQRPGRGEIPALAQRETPTNHIPVFNFP